MFKVIFKRYKSKQACEDIEDCPVNSRKIDVGRLGLDVEGSKLKELGLLHPSEWKLQELVDHPGLFVVKNVFTDEGQLQWIRRCVVDYPSPPNCNNLSPLRLLSDDENWFEVCGKSDERKNRIFRKIRWVTLGYHHDWGTKRYSENRRSRFPADLSELCRVVARVVGGWDFSAEAAIVNYYYRNSTINGHTDHSEPNLDAPLLSFSFGDSAVFLIGGSSLDDPASPVVIRSGDVVIMSGPSRLSYHGVPRIMPADDCPWARAPAMKDEETQMVKEFISYARVNMNVRQVLYPDTHMVGARCAVASCNNSYATAKKRGHVLSLHGFPKDKDLKDSWIAACSRGGAWNPDTSFVCSDHFTLDDFVSDQRLQLWTGVKWRPHLKPGAVPNRNLPTAKRSKHGRSQPREPHKRFSMFQVLSVELECRKKFSKDAGNTGNHEEHVGNAESSQVFTGEGASPRHKANSNQHIRLGDTLERTPSVSDIADSDPENDEKRVPNSHLDKMSPNDPETQRCPRLHPAESSVIYACPEFELFVDET